MTLDISAQTTFEWYSKLDVDKIIYPGQKHIFKQQCLPGEDSLIVNGVLIFHNSNIKDIAECRFKQIVKDTIITQIEFASSNRSASNDIVSFYESKLHHEFSSSNVKKTTIKLAKAVINEQSYFLILIKSRKTTILTIRSWSEVQFN